MSLTPDQMSAAAKSQLEAQFKFFNTVASTAVDSAEKVIALGLSATKASMEKSSADAKKLLSAKDARELIDVGIRVGSSVPPGLESLLAFGRQLFDIASSAHAELVQSAQGVQRGLRPAAEQSFTAPKQAQEQTPAPAAEPEPQSRPAAAAAAAEFVAEPVAETVAESFTQPFAEPSAEPLVAGPTTAPEPTPAAAALMAALAQSANEAVAAATPKPKAPARPKPVAEPAAAPIAAPAPVALKATLKPAAGGAAAAEPPTRPKSVGPKAKGKK